MKHSEDQPPRRSIRSFVLRGGRLTKGQQRAFDHHWSSYGLEYDGQRLHLSQLFGNSNPVYLEIGFGNGESLARMAQDHPENNYLGVEVHRPGVGHLLIRIEEAALTNIRILRHDAVEVVEHCLPDGEIAGIFLFFPDPWHKKRHTKRRIVQPSLAKQFARILQPGGLLHLATDWEDYAQHMLLVMTQVQDQFANLAGEGLFSPRPPHRPITKFERRGRRLGHGVWDLMFKRR